MSTFTPNINPIDLARKDREPIKVGDMATLEWRNIEYPVKVLAVTKHEQYGLLADVQMPDGKTKRVVMSLLLKRKPKA